jgi:hypothetical protein
MNQQSSEKGGRPPPAESNDAGTECRRGKSESNGVRMLSEAENRNQVALERSPKREIGSKQR